MMKLANLVLILPVTDFLLSIITTGISIDHLKGFIKLSKPFKKIQICAAFMKLTAIAIQKSDTTS